jgi:V-type H+-transporting ATPase subunit H
MIRDPVNLQYFHNADNSEVYQPLVKCLGMDDEFCVLAALRVLAVLIAFVD